VSILLTILALLTTLSGVVVLLSYTIAWYENANRFPELARQRFTPRNLLLTVSLLLSETFWVTLNLLLYPLGWLPRSERVEEGAGATQRPVILLHGLFLNQACWSLLRWRLRRAGFYRVHTLNLPPWRDVERQTEMVALLIDQLRHRYHCDQVDLIGHSMGGMIARNYLQLRGGETKVSTCILLGTPNTGSRLAPFALSPQGPLLQPGSPFLNRLNSASWPEGPRVINIFSRHDNLVLPALNARLEGKENIELDGVGHAGLLFRHNAFAHLLATLRQE